MRKRISEEKLEEIRKMFVAGNEVKDIALLLKVSKSVVYSAIKTLKRRKSSDGLKHGIYDKAEDTYILDNFLTKTAAELGEYLKRSKNSVYCRMVRLRKNNNIALKNNVGNKASSQVEIFNNAKRNQIKLIEIIKKIQSNKYIKIVTEDAIETVEVLNYNNRNFTIKHKNYRENFMYVEILMKTLVIAIWIK